MKEDIYIEYNDIEWVDNDSMSISIIMYTLFLMIYVIANS